MWSEKIVKFLHKLRIVFKRFFVTIFVIILGTGMLAINSLLNFFHRTARFYKAYPSMINMMFIILIAIPLICYGLEKGLSTYMQKKDM